ncbi:MAG: GNAT family N-acetyltransferase [Alphaproteobacteria bacterium]|nr:GNAT family N-acetyltransferase [Alphaproteobacteria bacterium]
MRNPKRQMSDAEAWALLGRAPFLHVAGTDPDGRPILRALNAAVADGVIGVHGARVGEKAALFGRPVVASAVEVIATVPSYAVHPERACPATTWYRSAQVEGVLAPVDDPDTKAALLGTLMSRFQPEGGYRPLDAADPMYRASVKGVAVLALRPERLTGKASLGQDKPAPMRRQVLTALWQRGAPGDVAAIDAALRFAPLEEPPGFLAGPPGVTMRCAMGSEELDGALALLRGAYWNVDHSDAIIAGAQPACPAWVGAVDDAGRVLATARGLSDHTKLAWIGDVAVHPEARGRGLGTAVMRLLLDHPAVRHARKAALLTKDAMGFYARLGFTEVGRENERSTMVRLQ